MEPGIFPQQDIADHGKEGGNDRILHPPRDNVEMDDNCVSEKYEVGGPSATVTPLRHSAPGNPGGAS
jgi:hypothetical protein